jgi:hypothetical protein
MYTVVVPKGTTYRSKPTAAKTPSKANKAAVDLTMLVRLMPFETSRSATHGPAIATGRLMAITPAMVPLSGRGDPSMADDSTAEIGDLPPISASTSVVSTVKTTPLPRAIAIFPLKSDSKAIPAKPKNRSAATQVKPMGFMPAAYHAPAKPAGTWALIIAATIPTMTATLLFRNRNESTNNTIWLSSPISEIAPRAAAETNDPTRPPDCR